MLDKPQMMQRVGKDIAVTFSLVLSGWLAVSVCGPCQVKAASAPESRASAAPAYPTHPIRIIVGFPPGNATDMLARFVGGKLGERMGQQVVVDNRPGANGIIGADLAVKTAPDGQTLLFMSASYTMNAALDKLPFDPVKSFTPVMMLATGPLVLVANVSFPASSVKGLIDDAMAKPNTITYASVGAGGINHFAGALLERTAGIQLIHVPYKGGAPALTDVIAGHVQLMFGTLPLTLGHIRAGKVKALGVSGMQRTPLLPEVPTIAESGAPGYEINNWWGVLAPAGVPPAIVAKLDTEIAGILNERESARRLEGEGIVPSPLSSTAFSRVLVSEIEKWARVAREANIKAE
jgi:tripartite-type tricarboxylate transporter receptor subunit TctC